MYIDYEKVIPLPKTIRKDVLRLGGLTPLRALFVAWDTPGNPLKWLITHIPQGMMQTTRRIQSLTIF